MKTIYVLSSTVNMNLSVKTELEADNSGFVFMKPVGAEKTDSKDEPSSGEIFEFLISYFRYLTFANLYQISMLNQLN